MSDGQIAPAALGRHWSPDELKLRKLVGMSLAIGGNLLISGALNVQKAVHNRNERLGPEQRRPYTKMPLWWAGFLMTILGELGNFAAYGFAEASLVTPLGAVTVVSNAFFAAIVLREGLRARDVCGCLLVVVGSAIIAANASMHEEYLDPSLFVRYASAPPFLAFSAALLAAICAAYGLRHRYGHRHVAYYVTLCALIGSITVMAAKGLSSFFNAWAYGGSSPLAHPTAYLLALTLGGTAVLQVRFLNLAMQHFGNTETVPVFYVLFTLATICASSILYRDFEDESAEQVLAFVCGCLVTFAGVKLITSNRQRKAPHAAGGAGAGGASGDVACARFAQLGAADEGDEGSRAASSQGLVAAAAGGWPLPPQQDGGLWAAHTPARSPTLGGRDDGGALTEEMALPTVLLASRLFEDAGLLSHVGGAEGGVEPLRLASRLFEDAALLSPAGGAEGGGAEAPLVAIVLAADDEGGAAQPGASPRGRAYAQAYAASPDAAGGAGAVPVATLVADRSPAALQSPQGRQ